MHQRATDYPLRNVVLASLLRAFTEQVDAPLLALEISSRLPRLDGLDRASKHHELVRRCEPAIQLLSVLKLNAELLSLQRLWLSALVYFHLGDPGRAFDLLDEAEAAGSEQAGAALQYYLLRSAEAILHEELEPIRQYAWRTAEAVVASPEASSEELYYAAHLLIGRSVDADVSGDASAIEGPRLRALNALDRCLQSDSTNRSAAVMRAWCLYLLGRKHAFVEAALRVLEQEEAAFASHRGILHPIAELELGPTASDVQRQIVLLARASELVEAVQSIWEGREEHPNLRAASTFLDVPLRHAVHALEGLRMNRELAHWLGSRTREEALRQAQEIRRDHPVDCSAVDTVAQSGGDVERWLGRTFYEKRASLSSDAHEQLRFALLASHISARAALTLGYFLRLQQLAHRGDPERLRRALRGGTLGAVAGIAVMPFRDGVETVVATAVAAVASAFIQEFIPTPESIRDLDYETFRRRFLGWMAEERSRLGPVAFHARYPIDAWFPELREERQVRE